MRLGIIFLLFYAYTAVEGSQDKESNSSVIGLSNVTGKTYNSMHSPWTGCATNDPLCREGCYRIRDDVKCELPLQNTRCFGVLIHYPVVVSQDRPSIDHFRIFQRFPSCWQKLAPLLCHLSYPACKTVNRNNSTSVLVATPSPSLCREAFSACSAFNLSALAEFTACRSADVYESPFSENCNNSSTVIPVDRFNAFLHEEEFRHCPSLTIPLSSHFAVSKVSPVIDQCYMQCGSLYAEYRHVYGIAKALIHGSALLFSFGLWFYLSHMSAIYKRSVVTFCLSHALFCNGLYNLAHFFDSSEYIRRSLLCHGEIQQSILGFNWQNMPCIIESILISFAVCSCTLWFFCHFLFLLLLPSCRLLLCRSEEVVIHDEDRLTGQQMRAQLSACIYLVSLLFGIATSFLTETDEIGACVAGLKSFEGFAVLYLPSLLLSLIALTAIPRFEKKRFAKIRENQNEAPEDSTSMIREMKKLRKRAELSSYSRCYAAWVMLLLLISTLLAGSMHILWIRRPVDFETDQVRKTTECQVNLALKLRTSTTCLVASKDEIKDCMTFDKSLSDRQLITRKEYFRALPSCLPHSPRLHSIILSNVIVFSLLPNLVLIPILIALIKGVRKTGGFKEIGEMRDKLPCYVHCCLQKDNLVADCEELELIVKRMQKEKPGNEEEEGEEHNQAAQCAFKKVVRDCGPPPAYKDGDAESESSLGSSLPSNFDSPLPSAVVPRCPSHERIHVLKPRPHPSSVAKSDGSIVKKGRKAKRAPPRVSFVSAYNRESEMAHGPSSNHQEGETNPNGENEDSSAPAECMYYGGPVGLPLPLHQLHVMTDFYIAKLAHILPPQHRAELLKQLIEKFTQFNSIVGELSEHHDEVAQDMRIMRDVSVSLQHLRETLCQLRPLIGMLEPTEDLRQFFDAVARADALLDAHFNNVEIKLGNALISYGENLHHDLERAVQMQNKLQRNLGMINPDFSRPEAVQADSQRPSTSGLQNVDESSRVTQQQQQQQRQEQELYNLATSNTNLPSTSTASAGQTFASSSQQISMPPCNRDPFGMGHETLKMEEKMKQKQEEEEFVPDPFPSTSGQVQWNSKEEVPDFEPSEDENDSGD